jgi:AraC-like DNA-binding protein
MIREERTVRYDNDLGIEAYRFKGIMLKFPNHFHEYYVIGFIEAGRRHLSCKNKEYTINGGDMILFNPLDNHTCEQTDGKTLDYRCINIKQEIMRKTVKEITGTEYLPRFIEPVAYRSEHVGLLRELHQMIMEEREDFEKEEIFYFLIKQLIEKYAEPESSREPEVLDEEIEAVCKFLEQNHSEHISLDELARMANRNKYSLLRAFTRLKGITPYRYLETVRVNQAKTLLEQGKVPIDAAIQTGFTDQSHFSKFFKEFIGLTPGQYRDIFIEEKRGL